MSSHGGGRERGWGSRVGRGWGVGERRGDGETELGERGAGDRESVHV